MIQIIGLMMAIYTVTRMMDLATNQGTNSFVKVVAIFGIIITILLAIGLLAARSAPGRL